MDVFREIRAQLKVYRSLLRRREAVRICAYVLAGLCAACLAGPYLAAIAADRTVPALRLVLIAVGALAAAALLAGVILPRRRFRRDGEVARAVGAASPSIASDLLSTVELEAEMRGSPRFSTALATALADDTLMRLDHVDPEKVAPRRRARRAALVFAATVVVYVACALVAPRPLRAGWSRLAHPPALSSIAERAAPVAEPLVGDIRLVLTYPAYTRRAPLVVPVATGDVVAPRGTRVALETTALRPAAKAKLVFETDGKEEAVELAVAGRTVSGAFVVDKPTQFRFVVEPPEGRRALVEAEPHRVEIETDRAPRVELIAPADELDVSSRRRVELAYSIDDDYGIAEIALVFSGNGKEERKILAPPAAGSRTAQAKFYWDLQEITFAPGTRIAYHLEVKDNDDVNGPNVGSSKTMYLRVYSPRERHEEVMARQQAVFEEAVRDLGARLELPAEDLDAHRGAVNELDHLVLEVAALLTLVGADTLAPKGLKEEVEGIHGRLEKLVRDEQGSISELEMRRNRQTDFTVPRGAFGEHDRKTIAELERDVLAMDDWLSRQRLEELLAISDELRQHRAKLKDLMAQYQRTRSPELRAEIEREMKAIEQRIAELSAKAAQLSSEVADRFVNSDAMDADEAQDCFAKVRELLDKGEVAAAEKQLEICSKIAEQQAESLEEGLRGLRGERFSDEEKAYGELLGEIADLETQQRKVAREADDLLDRYKEKAAQEMKARSSPQQEKARRTLERLKKEVGEIPRDGLTPFAQEELDALKKRLEDVGQMLDEGDVAEALSMARHAEEEIKTIGADIEDDLADGRPSSNKTRDADEQIARAEPMAEQLIKELEQATPSPQEMMSAEDRQRMSDLRKRQRELRDRAQKLQQKAQKKAGELPGQAGEMAQKGLGDAAEQMGRAEDRMGAPEPMGARDEAQGAAEKLGELQGKMQRSSRPTSVGKQDGRGNDDETVKIPGSEDYKPPEAFREDILDAMKKDKPPDAYKDQVKRYYQELVK